MDPLSLNYKSPPKRVVLGHLNHNGNSPISPMANLKLLTKVATSHFSMEENAELMSFQEEVEEVKSKCNRRLRSLSFICQKFLLMYQLNIPAGECKQISLGNLASSLGIEKRRVYDIINVVASLKMAVRVCKDKYKWYGNQNLTKHLSELKIYALQNNLDKQVAQLLKYQQNNNLEDNCNSRLEVPKITVDSEKSEDNRIGILCQKFVMMFLVVNEASLNLTGIAKLVLTAEQGKTGMRRLYDVANVLETLGIIKRYERIHKKPTFVYCGPKIDITESDLTNQCIGSVIQNVDYCDTSSDSSSDATSFRKIDTMLEVVCTELEKFDDGPKAKRKLCLDSNSNEDQVTPMKVPTSFIKAPTQSFRFAYNQIMKRPAENFTSILGSKKQEKELSSNSDEKVSLGKTVTFSQLKGSSLISAERKGASDEFTPVKVQQPIKIIKPIRKLFPVIQNGAIYRAVKNGNVIKLVKL